MTDSKLPAVKTHIRIRLTLFALSLITLVGAMGIFLLTQHIILASVLACTGFIFLGARQLVKKSLSLTSPSAQLQLSSPLNRLEHIKKEVSKCKFLENIETEGTQAANQADLLLHQYKNLVKILSEKFQTTELSFTRYLTSIDTTCLSIGENLIYIKEVLENLNRIKNPEQILAVQKLLNTTEEAIQQLSFLFDSITEMNTKEKYRERLEESMQEIKKLAERAKLYSKN